MSSNEVLFQKITDHRKVYDRFLEMFGSLFQTIRNMQTVAADVNRHYDDLFEHLQKQDPPSPGPPSHKRRKAHSFDSPAAGAVAEVAESFTTRNKSDTEVSNSILNQAIDLPDSEESFFALTQSPPVGTVRDPLSPRKESSNVKVHPETPMAANRSWLRASSDEQSDKKAPEADKKRCKKSNLSLSRFSSAFCVSPETKKQMEQLPIRQKQTTPKPSTLDHQENLAPVGKWTSKKTNPSVRKIEPGTRQTPPSVAKGQSSLLNRTRLRQTKLRFPDDTNKTTDGDNETYFEEFVVPSPTSFSGSRFLKSMKTKQQSSLVGTAPVDKEDNDVFKSPEIKTRKTIKTTVDSDDDNFDIDQTYFSEAEKVLIRPPKPPETSLVKVKPEPLTQIKMPPVLATETPRLDDEDSGSDTNSVIVVKPTSQDEIITIQETQPSKSDLFMEAIREERRKEMASRQTVLDLMGPPPLRQQPSAPQSNKPENPFPFRNSPLRKFPTVSGAPERRCTECTKHYRMLERRGLSPEQIRTKLARNCRECRQAQLHDTPPGFWNPEFSPTQAS